MARNGSGTYTFPSSEFNPAVSGETLTAASWNTLRADIETAISASIANDGQTTCSARIPFAAGVSATGAAVTSAAYARTGDANTGLYFPDADQVGLTAGGVAVLTATASSVTMPLATTFSVSPAFSTAITSATITTVDINGGNIDGTVIGATSAANATLDQVTANTYLSKEVTVADDAATSIAVSGGAYVFFHNAANSSAWRGQVYITATGTPGIVEESIGANVTTTTGALTGTDGTDAKVNVSVDSSNFYLENRSGTSRTFQIVIIGGS